MAKSRVALLAALSMLAMAVAAGPAAAGANGAEELVIVPTAMSADASSDAGASASLW